MQIRCLKCKGRGFCGKQECPLYIKAQSFYKVKDKLDSESFQGSSPTPFVGRVGYPHVNVGILAPPKVSEDVWEYDAPRFWSAEGYKIPDIVNFRSNLINSRFNIDVKQKPKLLETAQEVAMSSKPVDLEIDLNKKPFFKLSVDPYMAPTGPNADLKKAEITSNPKIHTKVDKVFSDTDLKANSALKYLHDKGFDENFLTKLLSVGTLGVKKDRKLVPTRWSITATDDHVCKHILEEVKQYKEGDYSVYFGGYLGNYYLVMFFPDVWSYELFEMFQPNTKEYEYTTDHEFYDGRKTYAHETAGGYYASRLAISEKMKNMKRQASCLVIRVITGEYSLPLGVWVVREATRKAMMSKPYGFEDRESMIKYTRDFLDKRFGFDIGHVLNNSKLLKRIRTQSKLTEFFKAKFN